MRTALVTGASDEAATMTGQTLCPDGGLMLL
jgi:NAD(P)-dependent dehydrogenase (short-subunit alcohol dehydrogenase family)